MSFLSITKKFKLQLDTLQAPSTAEKDKMLPSSHFRWGLQTVNTIYKNEKKKKWIKYNNIK